MSLSHPHRNSGYLHSLLHPHRNFGYLNGSLTPTHKFWVSPRVSYTHTEILDISTDLLHHTEILDISTSLLHPHRNSGYLHGSLTPIQKFWISPQVSYTHSEILDISTGLLHPHRNSGYLHGSLTPTQDLSNTTAGLLHPYRTFRILSRVSFTLFPGFSPEGTNSPLLASPNTH